MPRALFFALWLAALPTAGAAPLVIDAMEYGAGEAPAWTPTLGTPALALMPYGSGSGARKSLALRIDCPFSRDLERGCADRPEALDLSRAVRFTLDVRVERPESVGSVALYFRSGKGWYAGGSDDFGADWRTMTFERSSFRVEGAPDGWEHIDGIRISFWKAEARDTAIGVHRLAAEISEPAEIALVIGSNTIDRGGDEAQSAQGAADLAARLLNNTGIPFALLDEGAVERGALADARIAIFPYSPVVTKPEIEQLRKFVERGGRLFWFYVLPDELAPLLGVKVTGWTAQKYSGRFARIRFSPALAGALSGVNQRSWNISIVEPAGKNAKVAAS